MQQNVWEFPVEKREIFWQNDRGGFHPVKGKKAIVRPDTDEELAVVSNAYHIVTHDEVLKHLDPFVKKFGEHNRQVTTNKNGSRMVASYTFRNITKDVKLGDTVGFGVNAVSGYDGKTAIKMAVFALRLICTNGMASRAGYTSAFYRHNDTQVKNIEFPTPDYFLDLFKDDVDFWKELAETKATKEANERLLHNIKQTPGLLSDNQLSNVRRTLLASQSAWDGFNELTRYITHETEANQYTKYSRLQKINNVAELSYLQEVELEERKKVKALQELT